MKEAIEQALLNRVKFIGDNEQTYTGTPTELIDEIYNHIKSYQTP